MHTRIPSITTHPSLANQAETHPETAEQHSKHWSSKVENTRYNPNSMPKSAYEACLNSKQQSLIEAPPGNDTTLVPWNARMAWSRQTYLIRKLTSSVPTYAPIVPAQKGLINSSQHRWQTHAYGIAIRKALTTSTLSRARFRKRICIYIAYIRDINNSPSYFHERSMGLYTFSGM